MVHLIWALGGTLCAGLVGLLAYWRGGPPEKWGAVILLTGWAVTPLVHSHGQVQIGVMLVDLCVTIGFVWLSLKTRKLWSLFAAAFFVNDMATYCVQFIPGIDQWSFLTLAGLWGGWAPLLALAAGVLTHKRSQTT